MPAPTQKYEWSHLSPCREIGISWDGLQFLCVSLLPVPERTQKYEVSYLRASRQIDISWDCLQFLCISLWRSLLKGVSYPFSDHADKLILAETVFNFYALACAGAYSKSMSYTIWDHTEQLILAEAVFNFYALACAAAYSTVWVIPSQSTQKN